MFPNKLSNGTELWFERLWCSAEMTKRTAEMSADVDLTRPVEDGCRYALVDP